MQREEADMLSWPYMAERKHYSRNGMKSSFLNWCESGPRHRRWHLSNIATTAGNMWQVDLQSLKLLQLLLRDAMHSLHYVISFLFLNVNLTYSPSSWWHHTSHDLTGSDLLDCQHLVSHISRPSLSKNDWGLETPDCTQWLSYIAKYNTTICVAGQQTAGVWVTADCFYMITHQFTDITVCHSWINILLRDIWNIISRSSNLTFTTNHHGNYTCTTTYTK